MGRYPTKAAGNRYYESRKNAAEHDERLTSREAAGDLLGVSWSSMADYTGVLNVDPETGHIYDEDGDVVDEDTLGTFCAGDGKGDDEDE